MSSNKVYLITGANRGIGQGLTASLLLRPSTTVIAGVRDVAKSSAVLNELPTGKDSKVIVVKIDSQAHSDPANAVAELQSKHGITYIDVVIANAGISHSGGPVISNTAEALQDHFNINTVGPVLLFQATAPLLKLSKNGPVFVGISSFLGSLAGQEHLAAFGPTLSPYGVSKTALNWLFRRIHLEEPWLTAYVTHPGLVLTDMAAALAEKEGLDLVKFGAIPVDVSIAGILKTVDKASREISGTFQNYDGEILPW